MSDNLPTLEEFRERIDTLAVKVKLHGNIGHDHGRRALGDDYCRALEQLAEARRVGRGTAEVAQRAIDMALGRAKKAEAERDVLQAKIDKLERSQHDRAIQRRISMRDRD